MDLVDCDDISESAILRELDRRFQRNEIYSSIGPILIAVNPYKSIAGLYDGQTIDYYIQQSKRYSLESHQSNVVIMRDKPHVWMVPFAAYQQMRFEAAPQALVISGESGAGKTETTKLCLQLLSSLSQQEDVYLKTQGPPHKGIEDRILATNPVLESFGNSKTSRNNNSSRFGKWIQIHYAVDSTRSHTRGSHPELLGASITQYLLEKSRVVTHAPDERNYHIFYQLCASGTLGIQPAASYRFLRFSKNLKIAGVDDKAEFKMTSDSMTSLGFSDQEKDAIFSSLKAILLLGNVQFQDETLADGSVGASISSDFEGLVHGAAAILGLDGSQLAAAFKRKSMLVRGEWTYVQFSAATAQDALNALCKEIYGRVFNYLVHRVNESLQVSTSFQSESDSVAPDQHSIGLLDIFGFESFKFNSFEQLCINYANEKLHQYFITYVLKKEQELYLQEGIEVSAVIPIDNSSLLLLFEQRQIGIFSRLDDEVKLPKASDESFLKKVEANHNVGGNDPQTRRFFKDIKMSVTQFEIRHFAGTIRYDAIGFVEKNRDKLHDHLEDFVGRSSNHHFREIFTSTGESTDAEGHQRSSAQGGNSSSKQSTTIATRFQGQLQHLVDVLNRSQPHFIKCIKPNNSKQERLLEPEVVLQQLRYSGVLEAVHIRKSGYPIRRPLEMFWKQYWMLPPSSSLRRLSGLSDADKCQLIVKSFANSFGDIQIGRRFVFLRSASINAMENEKTRRGQRAIICLQGCARCKKDLRTFAVMLLAHEQLQDAVHMGEQFGSTNVDAIVPLQESILQAEQNNLPTAGIEAAKTVLRRLLMIRETLDKLDYFSDNDIKNKFEDVFEEYKAIESLLEVVKSLRLQAPQLPQIYERLSLLESRARTVEQLRAAVANGDDIAVNESLKLIQQQTRQHGAFCAADEAAAKAVVGFFEDDFQGLAGIIGGFRAYEKKFQNWKSNHEGVDALQLVFGELSKVVQVHMRIWENRSIASKLVQQVVDGLHLLDLLHNQWVCQDWTGSANTIIKLSDTFQTLTNINVAGSSSQREREVVQHASIINSQISLETQLIERDINVFFLVPMLTSALEQGKFLSSTEDINLSAVDGRPLQKLLDTLRGYSWLGESSQGIVRMIDQLSSLRSLIAVGELDKCLQITESPQERSTRLALIELVISNLWSTHKFDEEYLRNQIFLEHVDALVANEHQQDPGDEQDDFLNVRQNICEEISQIKKALVEKWSMTKTAMIVELEASMLQDVSDVDSFDERPITTVLTLWESLFPKGTVTAATSELIKRLIELKELRATFCQRDNNSIVERLQSGAYAALLQASSSLHHSCEHILEIISIQAALVVSYALSQFVQQECLRLVTDFSVDLDEYFFAENAKISAMQKCLTELEHNISSNRSLGAISLELFPLAASLVKLRQTVWLSSRVCDDDLITQIFTLSRNCENTLRDVEELLSSKNPSAVSLISAELEGIRLFLKFKSTTQAIHEALSIEHTELYFEPFQGEIDVRESSSRKRTSSTAPTSVSPALSSVGQRAKRLLDSVLECSPSITALPSGLSSDELLLQDGWITNRRAVVVTELETVINDANAFCEELEEAEHQVPAPLVRCLRTVDLLKLLREAVALGDWILALQVCQEFRKVDSSLFVTKEVTNEIEANFMNICNFAVILGCNIALMKGQPVGLIGQIDFKTSTTVQYLQEAITLCQTVDLRSAKLQNMFNAVLLIFDLRQAQKQGDWTEIRSILVRANSERNNNSLSELCLPEINRAMIERDNHDAIQALKAGIVNEEMFTKDSVLDTQQISTKELQAALAKANSVPEDCKGVVLRTLQSLGDTILKARKSALQKQYFVLESVVAVIKEVIEQFQDEIDGKNVGTRKTLSVRMSAMHRGTMLGKDKYKNSVIGPPGTDAANSSTRSIMWDEFAELNQAIKREIRAIDHHFAVTSLEQQLNETLSEGGVSADSQTGQIDRESIHVDKLREVLSVATSLDSSSLSLPKHLKAQRKVGLLVLDLRDAVLQDQWESMRSLLESTLSVELVHWPDYNRQEVRVVRSEVENRWIVSNLSNAIETGKLVRNAAGELLLLQLVYNHIPSAVSAAEAMHPTTEAAVSLLQSAKRICQLRKLVLQKIRPESFTPDSEEEIIPMDLTWDTVKKKVREIQQEIDGGKIHIIIQSEVKLIAEAVEDRIISDALEQALKVGRITGEPGAIHVSRLNVKDIDRAYQQAIRSPASKTEHVKLLMYLCRSIQKIRESVARAEAAFANSGNGRDGPRELSSDSWHAVRSLLNQLMEEREKVSSSNDSQLLFNKSSFAVSAWELCEEEIELIRKHEHVVELRNSLIDTSMRASLFYAQRHQSTIADGQDEPGSQLTVLQETMDALQQIVEKSKEWTFQCDILTRYLACATTLGSCRSLVVHSDWEQLRGITQSDLLRQQLLVLPEVENELCWIICEMHNSSVVQILKSALIPVSNEKPETDQLAHGVDKEQWDGNERSWDLSNLYNMSFRDRNAQLSQALKHAREFRATSKLAQQWVECCETMYMLRQGLLTGGTSSHSSLIHNGGVARALRWFKDNAHICPLQLKYEAQSAYVMFQNDLLVNGLTQALREGKPIGVCGQLQLDSIEVKALQDLLEQSKSIAALIPRVEELLSAARLALKIRQSLKDSNMDALRDIVDDVSLDESSISMLIVDEISVARAELDNEIVVRALADALKTFEDSETLALDFTFLSSDTKASSSQSIKEPTARRMSTASLAASLAAVHDYDDSLNDDKIANRQPAFSILESFRERRYSFANKNSTNIDPETIDIRSLDYGLRIARDHGVFGIQASRLYRTVELIRSLRLALKQSEWIQLESILSNARLETSFADGTLDFLANKEIQALKSQLEIRAAIVDLSKSLKIGWAKCSHGIVDTSSMKNANLADAIERAHHSIVELSLNVDSHVAISVESESDSVARRKKVQFDETPSSRFTIEQHSVQQQVNLLLESARLVLQIREILAMGDIEQAGLLAEDALTNRSLHYTVIDELKLYAKEINAALLTMRVVEELRNSMRMSRLVPLERALQSALENDIHVGSDLGLICILTRAEHQFQSLISMKKHLLTLIESEYDANKLETAIATAEKIRFTDEELVVAKHRLARLRQYEDAQRMFRDYWWRLCSEKNRAEIAATAIRYGRALQLPDHPSVLKARMLMRSSPGVFRSIFAAQTIVEFATKAKEVCNTTANVSLCTTSVNEHGDKQYADLLPPFDSVFFSIHTESIRLKRLFLSLPSSTDRFKLEKYSQLRRPEDFALRMNVLSEELKRQMLCYCEQPLPTSLTKLPPSWAAIATFVFSNHIRGLERNLFTHSDHLLMQLVQLGQQTCVLRDEILLQILKLLRNNPDLPSSLRLWKVLCTCLAHFPPSKGFESYLELFLIQASEPVSKNDTSASSSSVPEKRINRGIVNKINNTITVNTALLLGASSSLSDVDPAEFVPYARCAIRCLHQTVFRYGYDAVVDQVWMTSETLPSFVSTAVNADSSYFTQWLSDEFYAQFFAEFKASGAKLLENIADNTKALFQSSPALRDSVLELPQIDLTCDVAFLPIVGPSAANNLRGTREDWINRFRAFNNSSSGKDGGYITRTKFCSALASTLSSKSESSTVNDKGKRVADMTGMDQMDRDVFYFILLGKRVNDPGGIQRELSADEDVFHFTSDDESRSSRSRRQWLEANVNNSEFASELFFSQLQASDINVYAERFWDSAILKMSNECMHFPFLHWEREIPTKTDSGTNRSPSARKQSTVAESQVSMSWELYRELVLTGMKSFLSLSTAKH